ncbi:hypothetical protein C8F01DRAFT_1229531 [Mycena amicta]|nr:hypothetical protein C8F01DRAFT_1229531 [Mycena amicta]
MTDPPSAQTRLQVIEAQILDFSAKLAALRAEEAAIRASLSTSILDLPPEIMLSIFETHLPEKYGDTFVLSQVCSSWRVLVVGTSTLWHHIPVDAYTIARTHDPIQLLHLRLKRSGTALVDVSVTVPDGPYDAKASADTFRAALNLVSQHTPRWGSLSLSCENPDGISLDWIKRHQLTALTSLSVAGSNWVGEGIFYTLFARPPRLGAVSMATLLLGMPTMNWGAITRLELCDLRCHRVLPALAEAHSLETLHVVLPHAADSCLYCTTSISLPRLHTLQVSRDSEAMLIRHLTLTNLHSLTITSLSSDGVTHVEEFAERSACTLQELTLRDLQMDDIHRVIVALHDGLAELTLASPQSSLVSNLDPTAELNNFLTSVGNKPTFLPALVSLRIIELPRNTAVDVAALATMLSARKSWVPGVGAADGRRFPPERVGGIRYFKLAFIEAGVGMKENIKDDGEPWTVVNAMQKLRRVRQAGVILEFANVGRVPTQFLDQKLVGEL